MRTTVTLEPDVDREVQRLMREQGVGFKEMINELLRRGLGATETLPPYEPPRFSSGVRPGIDLTKALTVAAQLEDDEFVRRYELGK